MTKSIGWGLIGASRIAAEKMIPALRATPDCEVVSVMSSSAERALAYAAEHQISQGTDSLNALLENPAVDAVYISTTNELHKAQVLAAAAAGKHVLCEKPLAMQLEDAQQMAEACRKAGVVMATNHHLRSSHSHQIMRELVRDGAIGQVNSARVFHAVQLPERLQGWRIDKPDAGGGVVLDITVHDIDSLRFILDADPVEVTSLSHNMGMAREDLEDGNMAVVRFDNRALAYIHVSFAVPHAGHGLEIHGSEGSIISSGTMTHGSEQIVVLRTAEGECSIPVEASDYYLKGTTDFVAAMRGEGQPAASAEDGIWSLASALAVLASAESGSVQRIMV